jgi:D-alanyl-D-alanine endopeptidase (penicillin-binding protein 7)
MTFTSRRIYCPHHIWKITAFVTLAFGALTFTFFRGSTARAETAFAVSLAAGTPAQTSADPGAHSTKLVSRRSSATQASRSRFAVKSKIALVVDANTSEKFVVKEADRVVPIASITKLMTAMVVLDAKLPMGEMLRISDEDRDLVMATTSRLQIGWKLSREDMLHLALMSSENRAAAALSRYHPGGRPAFIAAMNAKAAALGMTNTHFVNPNGLTTENVSTAFDLAKLVRAAARYPLIRQFTTDPNYVVRIGRYVLPYFNSNRLVGRPEWDIEVQKTGFTNEAGRCLVMQVNADGRSLVMVFLDGNGKLTRYADARRVVMQLAALQKK